LSFNHKLRSISLNILIYLCITLVPSSVISYYLAQHEVKVVKIEYLDQAQEYANFHAMNIENFLGETVGRLEMLATSIKIQPHNLTNIEKILKESAGKDPRFSGFYWIKPNGDVLISSNPISSLINISDLPYFQQALKTDQTTVSDAYISRVTGHFIIAIATPIVDHGQLQGVLVSSLNIREIEKAINTVMKNEMIIVVNPADKTIIKAGTIRAEERTVKSSMAVSQVPWTISAYVISDEDLVFRQTFLQFFIGLFTIMNIVFLAAIYLLLRRKIKKEQKQTEVHKLELIGNLAASTAHEIRNPLTGIKGLIKLLSEEYQDKKAQTYFNVIQQEVDRINIIVSELLVLGKPTAYTLKTYDANIILKEIEPIIHSEANFMNVQLFMDYSTDELLISCVKDHLKQVILNLAKNSLQAMPYGGKLVISLEKRSDTCVIRVEDNGVGMQKEQLSQAFNPFYTLKKDGSGLGLTVCKRIIESYGGNISMDSTPTVGTQAEITLPLVKE
jgi:two-component system, sporulation sensor kinase D